MPHEKGWRERERGKAGLCRQLCLQDGVDPSFSLQFSHILRQGEASQRLTDADVSSSLSNTLTHTHGTALLPASEREREGKAEREREPFLNLRLMTQLTSCMLIGRAAF